MNDSDYKSLLIKRDAKILRVSLNRPDALNAVNAQLHDELVRLWLDVQDDPDIALVVLTGEGRAFCAGGDINWMGEDEDAAPMATDMAKRLVLNQLSCEKPIIASLNGDAVGVGATLALFCDIIIASDKARIGDPHVKAGLSAGDGGAIIWPQLIGYARAKEYLMTGDLIPAPKAAEMGLINYAVPPAELQAKTEEMVNRLANGALKAISYTKATVNIGLRQMAEAMLDAGTAYEFLTMETEDHKEAVVAFQEGRKPVFKGR
jgi:enoyl-CoA hydratase